MITEGANSSDSGEGSGDSGVNLLSSDDDDDGEGDAHPLLRNSTDVIPGGHMGVPLDEESSSSHTDDQAASLLESNKSDVESGVTKEDDLPPRRTSRALCT